MVMMVEEIIIFNEESEGKGCFYNLLATELGDSNFLLPLVQTNPIVMDCLRLFVII